ncbi:MAG TPA: c-type cytochrome biogenesis protein CcsB [Jiangellales bacterium]|nr:c-type cytochrome biogenesis protein CcsB [Jiangellales bacterium]
MSTETLAQLSDNLVYGAMAAFAVAMVALAAEAASRRVPTGAPADRSLVATGATDPESVSGPGPAGRRDGSGPTAPDAQVPPEAAGRADRYGRVGTSVLVLGTILLGLGVLTRGLAAGRVPWSNMYGFAISGTFVVALVYLVAARRQPDLRALGVWVVATLLLTLGLAVTVLYVPVGPLVPSLQSYWLVIHVAAATIAAAVFTIAMVASALQIVAERAEHSGRRTGYAGALPPAERLDALAYRVTAFGFPLWTFAVVAGAIWAEASWGRYWGWDPKEVWSLVTWLVYAAYLHARTTAGWRGRRASVVGLVAYASLIFNFFGVNILFEGLHSYGGL